MVRRLLGRKIDRLMRHASVVIAGNEYIADRARRAGAKVVDIVPSTVSELRYASGRPCDEPPVRVVWVGSPPTAKYLGVLRQPLIELATEFDLVLRIVGAAAPDWPEVQLEAFPWSEDTEVQLIAESHIGVMPLDDTPWERGKCGFKLIQYMACGLPVVASPVGANVEIVGDSEVGYLASDVREWTDAIRRLAADSGLRKLLGSAGCARVKSEYSAEVAAVTLARIMRSLDNV